MDFNFQELQYLSDLETMLNSNEINNCLILKSIAKLIFSVLKQISQLPFVLGEIKKELYNNKCFIEEMFNKSVSTIEENLNIQEMKQKLEHIGNEQKSIKEYMTQIQNEFQTTNIRNTTEIVSIKEQLTHIEEDQQKIIKMKEFDMKRNIFDICAEGNLNNIQWLIENENVNPRQTVEKYNLDHRYMNNDTLIHIATKFGHLPIVKYLVEKQNIYINTKGECGRTSLHYACANGNFQIVEYLILKDADIFARDDKENSIIHSATIEGHLPLVKYLIEKHNIGINNKDEDGKTPLHIACEKGYQSIIDYFISKGADVFARDDKGYYAIHYAAIGGYLSIVKYLIEQHNFDVNSKGSANVTPLHEACLNGHLQIVEYLISKGADLYAKDKESNYSIHYAAIGGHLPIIKYFIEQHNFDVNIRQRNLRTPLHEASSNGHLPVVEYLISKGADINAYEYTAGYKSIHLACNNGHFFIVQYFIEKLNVNIEIKSSYSHTPLICSCIYGHFLLFNYLISKGANLMARMMGGGCIHRACRGGYLHIVEYLIEEQNIDKNIRDEQGKTPLHYACIGDRFRIFKYLLSLGADINIKDYSDQISLDYLSYGNRDDYIIYVKSIGADKYLPKYW